MKWQHVATVLAFAVGTAASAQQVQSDVRAFVQGASFPGSYRELADSYDASVTPQLVEMLSSKDDEEHWDRIASTLGAVGDERAVNALIAFIEKPVGSERLSTATRTYRAAIMSLGILLNRTGSEHALRYLVDSLTPGVWRQRGVQAVAAWSSSYEEYDRELSKYSLFGLAISGNAAAGQALKSLQQSPTPGQAQFRSGVDSTLTQWLEVHQLVADRGVAGMYDYYAARRAAQAEKDQQEAERLRAEAEERQGLRDAQRPAPR